MTATVPPPELRTLAEPWNLTSARARASAVARLRSASSADPTSTLESTLAALDAALEVAPGLPSEGPDLPEELTDYFDFTAAWLAEAMPILADISIAGVDAQLRTRPDIPSGPRSAESLAWIWVGYLVHGIIREALALLRDTPAGRSSDARIASTLPASVRDGLAAVVTRELPRQPAATSSRLLSALVGLGGPADGLVDAVARRQVPGLDPEQVEHARRLQTWRESIRRPE